MNCNVGDFEAERQCRKGAYCPVLSVMMSVRCFLRLLIQRQGQTSTRVIKLPIGMPHTPRKALSKYMYLGGEMSSNAALWSTA